MIGLAFGKARIGWNGQSRDAQSLSVATALQGLWPHLIFGVYVIGALWLLSPTVMWWAMPLIAGVENTVREDLAARRYTEAIERLRKVPEAWRSPAAEPRLEALQKSWEEAVAREAESRPESPAKGLLAEMDKRKAEAEQTAAARGAQVSVFERAQRITQGEPQVSDLAPLYRSILERVIASQPLAPDALPQLAKRRSDAIVEALKTAGVEAARLTQPAVEKTDSAEGKPVPLKLGLSSR